MTLEKRYETFYAYANSAFCGHTDLKWNPQCSHKTPGNINDRLVKNHYAFTLLHISELKWNKIAFNY